MQKQKRISTLSGIIIILAVAVILFGGVFAWQYYSTKNPNIPAFAKSYGVAKQTAGWKTYTNSEYGFEIKYPDDFVIDSDFGFQGIHFRSSQNEQDYKKSLIQCNNTAHPGVCADMVADETSDLVFLNQDAI